MAIVEQMTRRMMENPGVRLKQCLRNGGRHVSDVISKLKMACTEFSSDNNLYIRR